MSGFQGRYADSDTKHEYLKKPKEGIPAFGGLPCCSGIYNDAKPIIGAQQTHQEKQKKTSLKKLPT
ncbi:MAG: hypothetical protein KAS32_03645 [Candidatus Peribacteraceae bacterium]|nr:hypothetical protein [Candidatus Peribacteraceae bacterium]